MMVCFQAEDGIRDLVRSRGLGDVYKRQDDVIGRGRGIDNQRADWLFQRRQLAAQERYRHVTVSYTHLTLPTSDLV